MTIKSFRICCSVSLVASCLGLDSRTQAHSLLSLINSHWTSVLCLDATGTPELARVTLQCIQTLKATGRKPKEPISGKQGRHHDSGFRGAPRAKLALIFVDLMRFPGKQFGFAWFQREIMKWATEGKGGLVACESWRAYSLRRQRECSPALLGNEPWISEFSCIVSWQWVCLEWMNTNGRMQRGRMGGVSTNRLAAHRTRGWEQEEG